MSIPLYFLSADAGLVEHWRRAGLAGHTCVWTDLPTVPAGIVFLDAALPELDWVACVSLVARHRVVLLSLNPDDAAGFAALSAGCAGYCHALASAEQLQQVLDVVTAGEIWAGRSLVTRMIAAMQKLPQATNLPDLSVLSEREQEVAQLAAKGLANKEIARELAISERTVKAHLTSTFAKLGVHDRVQLVLRIKGLG